MERRGGYGFSDKTKELARKRASGSCEHSDCTRPNTNRVNHLTGCLEAKVKGMPKSWTRGLDNTVMQCVPHEIKHDEQERENIIYERTRRYNRGTELFSKFGSNKRRR